MKQEITVPEVNLNTALNLHGNISSGLYLVRITSGFLTQPERLVIQL